MKLLNDNVNSDDLICPELIGIVRTKINNGFIMELYDGNLINLIDLINIMDSKINDKIYNVDYAIELLKDYLDEIYALN